MQLQSPPSVCRGFSPETDPRPTTKEQNPAQILSPHFTRQELPSTTLTPHIRNSLIGHSLACSTPAHSQIPTDRGKFWVRALLLWGPHPANLPVNSRLQSCWSHTDPEERLNHRSHKEAPSVGRVRPKKKNDQQRTAERRVISWQREKHTHSCKRSMTFLMCSCHKKGFTSNFKGQNAKYLGQMPEWSTQRIWKLPVWRLYHLQPWKWRWTHAGGKRVSKQPSK